MGNTHEETDVLPGSRRDEDSQDKTSLIVEERVVTSENPYRRRARQSGTMGLDYNTTKRRSSLGLIVQSDMVFIVFYDAHRPKNIIEGHGNMMTKGNEVSEECFLRRRAFVVKEMIKKTRHKKRKATIQCTDRCQRRI